MTSCSSLPAPVAGVVSAPAQTTAVACALRMAATAAEIFGLDFIAHSPGSLRFSHARHVPDGGQGLWRPSIPVVPMALEQTRHPNGTHDRSRQLSCSHVLRLLHLHNRQQLPAKRV